MKVLGIVLLSLSLLALAAGGVESTMVINEIDVSSSGGQYYEFVELYNAGPSTINLLNYKLEVWFDDGEGSYFLDEQATKLLLDFNVTAGGYYVMCVVPGLIPGCVQELHDYEQGWLPDNGAYLVLFDPEGNQLDLVGYAQGSPVGESCETAPALSDDSVQASQTIARYPNGQDTNDNSVDFAAGCATPASANVLIADIEICFTTTLSDIVINEIDYTQPGSDNKEFIELHNRANYDQTSSNIASYVLNIIDDTNATVLTTALSAAGYQPNIPVHGYWILCVAGSADFCTGPGARPVGEAIFELPSAIDWLPNPGGESSSYSIQLVGPGGILDVLTYGGTQPGVTLGTGVDDIDRANEGRFGVSRYPDSWDTANNAENFRATCITPNDINTVTNVNCDPANSPSPSPTNSPSPSQTPTNSPTQSPTMSPTQSPTRSPTPSVSLSPTTTPSPSPVRNAIPSALALCEKEKIDDAEEEARLLAQRKKFCRQYVPESETKRDNEREAMEAAYEEAAQCWYDKAAECPVERRSEARFMAKELKVTLQLHNKEIDSIPKPKRGLARADKDDEVDVEGGKAKRWDILWDPLTEPYPEDLEYSLEYCEKKREYIRFYHKALRYKIIACNETRAYYDCQRDAYTRFKDTYEASNADCSEFSCEL
ncbi:uncharacterized protein ACA1_068130 [Acanthamoeba castellanii str. Neff]|uniref:LTD domain-containing protein n=1 Tax=Acanthamoeba castellanii (strain ATCC 30010 / Neff) TaxID=1257118 RepID=L8HCH0_ACACF|nr:uncharacterized protein ACA1_068130 [Acanthamoeba castellanii str. Neff]ELR23229.1 hypothetical protein ACA1_068130 [Acanthamoeba castellanii str. Neff]